MTSRPVLLPLLLVVAAVPASGAIACSEDAATTTATTGAPDAGALGEDDAGPVTAADAATDAEREPALPPPPETGNRGAVFVTSDATATSAAFSAGAAFFTRTSPDLSVTAKSVGPCRVEVYGSGASAKDTDRSAGKLTITGGARSVVLTPAVDKTYPTADGKSALFTGGETLTLTAEGADVPAFTTTVVAPAKLTLTAPAVPASGPLGVARAKGVAATWSGTSRGEVVLYFDATNGDEAHAATCIFPASAGAGTVPPEAFAAFPAGAGTFNAYVKTVAVLTPADGYIRLTASSVMVDARGKGTLGDALFE